MGINEFSRKVCSAVEKELGKNYKVELKEVKKNNGVLLHGMLIHLPEQNVIPTIYLDSFWEAYESGVPFAAVMRNLMKIYREDTPKRQVDMSFFYSFEKVKDNICYRLIRKKGNESLLEDIPHVEFLDLIICFFYVFQNHVLGDGTILIHNTHMDMWDTDEEALFGLAMENTPRLFPWECNTMDAMMTEIMGVEDLEDFDGMFHRIPMKILSNAKRIHGAGCILYPNLAENLAVKEGGSYYILPSSVHEVIILKDTGMEDPVELRSMVKEVNRDFVAPEEVLSDSLYYYDFAEKAIKRLF